MPATSKTRSSGRSRTIRPHICLSSVIGMSSTSERDGTWQSVLHGDVEHLLGDNRKQLHTGKQLFGIAQCGTVCTFGPGKPGDARCATCFPRWPDEEDTQLLPRAMLPTLPKPVPKPALPTRVPKPAPGPIVRPPGSRGWFET